MKFISLKRNDVRTKFMAFCHDFSCFTQIPSLDLNFSKFVIYEIFILFLIIFVLELKYCGFYNVS